MKNLISVIAIAIIFSACNNNSEKEAASKQQATIDSMKAEMAKKQIIDSVNEMNALRYSATPTTTTVVTEPAPGHVVRHRSHVYHSTAASNGYAGYAQPQKRGWSAKAKGAVIGAGAGALTGALVSRQKGKGALIGGILGAGAGLGTGAIIDHNKGR